MIYKPHFSSGNYGNWLLHKGWPLNRRPLSRGSNVVRHKCQRKGRTLKYFHTQSTVYRIIIPNFGLPRRVSFFYCSITASALETSHVSHVVHSNLVRMRNIPLQETSAYTSASKFKFSRKTAQKPFPFSS